MPRTSESSSKTLLLHWFVVGVMAALLVVSLVFCNTKGFAFQQPLPEHDRILLRTILYVAAILTLPLTNLIRHIQLRLNQTMPGDKSAKSRYLLTVLVSAIFSVSIGGYGLLMYLRGDGFNTLYIFTWVSALGLYLYRPKADEYQSIVSALTERESEAD